VVTPFTLVIGIDRTQLPIGCPASCTIAAKYLDVQTWKPLTTTYAADKSQVTAKISEYVGRSGYPRSQNEMALALVVVTRTPASTPTPTRLVQQAKPTIKSP
jgi:hypothetical protein